MSTKYNSVFDGIHSYVRGGPLAGWVLILAIITLVIGINDFAEDTYSSYVGVQMIEQTFGVRPASWELTYWLMSLFFQVVSVLFFFAYLSDRHQNWWALWVAGLSQVVDFVADVWYRGNGTFSLVNTTISVILTAVFFTIGSEMALTFGFGLTSKLFVEGSTQLSITVRNVFVGIRGFFRMLASGDVDGDGGIDSTATMNRKPTSGPSNIPNNNRPSGPPVQFKPPASDDEFDVVFPGKNGGGGKPEVPAFRAPTYPNNSPEGKRK